MVEHANNLFDERKWERLRYQLADFELKIKSAKMVLLCNPHNPQERSGRKTIFTESQHAVQGKYLVMFR